MRKKTDKILDLVDVPEMSVSEDKYHNLVIRFEKDYQYEKGDTIKIWSSKIYEKGKEDSKAKQA